jgi:hypothetical protein
MRPPRTGEAATSRAKWTIDVRGTLQLIVASAPVVACLPCSTVNVRGTTRLTSAAIGEVVNRACDVVIWLMSANAMYANNRAYNQG